MHCNELLTSGHLGSWAHSLSTQHRFGHGFLCNKFALESLHFTGESGEPPLQFTSQFCSTFVQLICTKWKTRIGFYMLSLTSLDVNNSAFSARHISGSKSTSGPAYTQITHRCTWASSVNTRVASPPNPDEPP